MQKYYIGLYFHETIRAKNFVFFDISLKSLITSCNDVVREFIMKREEKILFLILLITFNFFLLKTFVGVSFNKFDSIDANPQTNKGEINDEIDPYLSSISSSGNIYYEWIQERPFYIYSMKIDSQDNIYIAGWSGGLRIAKYNTSGDLLLEIAWSLGGIFICNDIDFDSEGNIYATGRYEKVVFIVKFNKSGDYQWHDTWDGITTSGDLGNGIAVDSSNNVYITGYTSVPPSDTDLFLLKYDNMGNQLWNRTWGGSNSERGQAIRIDQSDNIYIAGDTRSFGTGRDDMVIIKYDTSGNVIWDYVWGGDDHDYGNILTFDLSGNIYLGGTTWSYGEGNADMVFLKFDNDGTLISNHTWGTSAREISTGLEFDSSGNLYATGTQGQVLEGTKLYIIKFDHSLEYEWYMIHPNNDYWDVGGGDIRFDSKNNIYLSGNKMRYATGFLMKCNPNEIKKKPRLEKTISLTTTFETSMELFMNSYADGTHRVTAIFKIKAYTDSLLIEVNYESQLIQYTKIIVENKASQVKSIYSIGEKQTLQIDSYNDYNFVFYLNYTHTYRSCIEDDGIYCNLDEERIKSGEKYSKLYDFSPENPLISGFSLFYILSIIFTLIIYVIRRTNKLYKST